jgi:hypothetical protein
VCAASGLPGLVLSFTCFTSTIQILTPEELRGCRTGHSDGNFRVWSLVGDRLQLFRVVKAHKTAILAMVADPQSVWSCTKNGTLRQWSIGASGYSAPVRVIPYDLCLMPCALCLVLVPVRGVA